MGLDRCVVTHSLYNNAKKKHFHALCSLKKKKLEERGHGGTVVAHSPQSLNHGRT